MTGPQHSPAAIAKAIAHRYLQAPTPRAVELAAAREGHQLTPEQASNVVALIHAAVITIPEHPNQETP